MPQALQSIPLSSSQCGHAWVLFFTESESLVTGFGDRHANNCLQRSSKHRRHSSDVTRQVEHPVHWERTMCNLSSLHHADCSLECDTFGADSRAANCGGSGGSHKGPAPGPWHPHDSTPHAALPPGSPKLHCCFWMCCEAEAQTVWSLLHVLVYMLLCVQLLIFMLPAPWLKCSW